MCGHAGSRVFTLLSTSGSLFTFLSKVNMPHVHVHSQLYMQLITVNYAHKIGIYIYTN